MGIAKINDYKELHVWIAAKNFVKTIYEITSHFPSDERFGLVSQLRRAVISIPANIAEGYARQSRKEYIQFISIAFGSAVEIETFIIISYELGFLSEEEFDLINVELKEILKMLSKLLTRLKETM